MEIWKDSPGGGRFGYNKYNVNILDRFGSHLYKSYGWVNSFTARILTSFLCSRKASRCVSLGLYLFTYVSEMIVCHAIYVSVINEIQKRTVVFLWKRVINDKYLEVIAMEKVLSVTVLCHSLSTSMSLRRLRKSLVELPIKPMILESSCNIGKKINHQNTQTMPTKEHLPDGSRWLSKCDDFEDNNKRR